LIGRVIIITEVGVVRKVVNTWTDCGKGLALPEAEAPLALQNENTIEGKNMEVV
jgi:hypothetical protein